ncbi:glycosyltransferase family 2 protein [Arthrobacter rhombi]|uniref:glycosyltransferase family 2 protein n=1 Tax=Arthrobacter rhombi TaxID=71253 RepID=UPI0031D75ABA
MPGEPLPSVCYVMPVLNEAEYIRDAVEGILSQRYGGAKEIVLALGPSVDGTTGVVREMAATDARIRWVENPKGRTPIGLNLAIKASTAPIIVRVDAHSILDLDYTQRGVATLSRTGAADVGGRMDARGRNPLQRAAAAAYNSPFGLGGAAYHSGAPDGPAESAYLGIFRREIFDQVGFYDETLWRGQDWELCLRIRNAGAHVWFDPQLSVSYYPRDRFRSLGSQSYAAGVWRGELARRYPEGRSLRHFVPPVMAGSTVAGLVAWLVPAKKLSLFGRIALRLVRAAPLVYAGLVGSVACRADLDTPKERALLAGVLPAIHFPWAWGFVKGRLQGAGETADRSRLANSAASRGGDLR